jgi:putative molybdopterin biosynthesis protein
MYKIMLGGKTMNDVNEQKIYNVEEAANLLRLSYRTIIRLIKKGNIRAAKLGRQYRISQDEIQRLLQQQLGG